MRQPDGQLLFLRRMLRLLWLALSVWLLAWLVWKNLPPSGKLSAVGRTAEPSGFFGGFTPLDRAVPVRENGIWYSDVSAEPVYFQAAAPRLFDTIRVRLRYQEEGQPYLALGARTDPSAWAFDLKPIDVPLLDRSGWSARQEGELRVYERRPTTRSAADLLKETSGRIAVLNLDPARWGLKLPALRSERPVEAVTAYAGSRKIYVYVQEGSFEMTLGLRGPASAASRVSLVRDGQILLTRSQRGDGAVALTLSGARPGLYRVDLDAPGTVSLVGLRTPHQRVVFLETDGARLKVPDGAVPFEPEFPIVTWETDLAKAPYDAIVARYAPPMIDAEGWRTAAATFRLRDLAAVGGRVQMLLSAPALKSAGGKIRIDRVELEYERPSFGFATLFDFFTPKK